MRRTFSAGTTAPPGNGGRGSSSALLSLCLRPPQTRGACLTQVPPVWRTRWSHHAACLHGSDAHPCITVCLLAESIHDFVFDSLSCRPLCCRSRGPASGDRRRPRQRQLRGMACLVFLLRGSSGLATLGSLWNSDCEFVWCHPCPFLWWCWPLFPPTLMGVADANGRRVERMAWSSQHFQGRPPISERVPR